MSRDGTALGLIVAIVGIAPIASVADAEANPSARAERSLSRAQAVFAGERPGRSHPSAVLADLVRRAAHLSPRDRRTARGLVARPTDGANDVLGDGYTTARRNRRRICRGLFARGKRHTVCVHWVKRGADAPRRAGRRKPGQVSRTLVALRRAWRREVGRLGMRPPVPDKGPRRGQGPNDGLDVYLADVGRLGVYGYCTPDRIGRSGRRKRAVYCVIDDDFAARQYAPQAYGRPALKVTLAHEFFHAIQSAYRFDSALWLKEGTAVWAEDLVHPGIDDHHRYLSESPLLQPEVPLTAFAESDDAQNFEYGAFVFWEFLTQRFGEDRLIRAVWRRVGRPGGTDELAAVAAVAGGRSPDPGRCLVGALCGPGDFEDLIAEFEHWNRFYPFAYDDGFAYYSATGGLLPLDDAVFVLGPGAESTGPRSIDVPHLASRSIFVSVPGESSGTLRISVASSAPSDTATVLVDGGADPGESIDLESGGGSIDLASLSDARLILGNAASSGSVPVGYELEWIP